MLSDVCCMMLVLFHGWCFLFEVYCSSWYVVVCRVLFVVCGFVCGLSRLAFVVHCLLCDVFVVCLLFVVGGAFCVVRVCVVRCLLCFGCIVFVVCRLLSVGCFYCCLCVVCVCGVCCLLCVIHCRRSLLCVLWSLFVFRCVMCVACCNSYVVDARCLVLFGLLFDACCV